MHGCYRCGEQGVEYTEDDEYTRVCGSCGAENSIVSFQEALDLLNEAYLRNIPFLLNPEEYEIEE